MTWINSVTNNLIKDWAENEGITYEQELIYICPICVQEVGKHDFECDNCGVELEEEHQ